ncbi:MAG TPA: primary-amine oxidase [Gaiellales bacterium]|nr:primary-amine oxidase [Gaiellales bacterium]
MTPAPHPLDPLSADELERAVACVRSARDLGGAVRFVCVELRDPDKSQLASWRAGGTPPPREAALVVLVAGRTYEAVVGLDADTLLTWEHVPGAQAAVTGDEYAEAEVAVKADPGFRQALARRGVADLDLVMIDTWTVGRFEQPDRRVGRALAWLRSDLTGDNGYARPIGGLLALVDLNDMHVIRVDDHGALPVPEEHGDYREGGGRPYRSDLRPIEVTQPQGTSLALDGHALSWGPWRLRIGFNPRESLTLHELTFDEGDGAGPRPIAHRLSIAELAIPYADTNPTVVFKNAFDIGEYGLGPYVNSLSLGCDCLGEIRYLDALVHDSQGRAQTIANAICVHEEDTGILWKHYDWRSGATDVRRARRLVISSIATVGNYEYALYWYLALDGSLAFEAKLTGVLHTAGVAAGEQPGSATLVAPGVSAGYHQHFFCARLDLDIDGERNALSEVDSVPDPAGPANPHGQSFHVRETPLASELAAQRLIDPLSGRRWRVSNPARSNRMGRQVAYELVPGENVGLMADEDSEFARRARFMTRHLWATPYRRDERYPAGEYPNQHAGGDGLPRWTAADRALVDTDIVLWYVFGSHHVPRLEDWPVMPVVTCGFQLRPLGFFDRNPALDVPPQPGHRHPL